MPDKEAVIIDTVAFENLAVGEEYVLIGTLMDRESGKPLTSGGKPVVAVTTFVPEEPSGTMEVRFTFDARAIIGRTLVVFESLEYDGVEIAVHADIEDEGQSVTVDVPEPPEPPKPPTPPAPSAPPEAPPEPVKPVPQTGDDYMLIVWLALAGVSLSGLFVGVVLARKKKRRAYIAVIVLSAALLAGSAFMAFSEWRQYADGADTYAALEQYAVQPVPDGGAASEVGEEEAPALPDALEEAGASASASSLPSVDFDALREVNPDVVGWLTMEGTALGSAPAIHYPIAQGPDNTRYLRSLFSGGQGKAGTPFLDFENSPDFTDRNSIIYGHNLLDGSMFSCLTEYAKQDYFDAHPAMLLLTPGGSYRVEVFAAFTASPGEAGTDASPWRQEFDTDEDFAAWIAGALGRSAIETGVAPGAQDRVLTLSTCINGGCDRFVVMGRLVPAE